MITPEQIDKCISVARKNGVTKLVLFGSAKEDPANARDIDFICNGISGLALLRMAAEMEDETGVNVDAVPGDTMNGFVRFNLPRGRVLYAAA